MGQNVFFSSLIHRAGRRLARRSLHEDTRPIGGVIVQRRKPWLHQARTTPASVVPLLKIYICRGHATCNMPPDSPPKTHTQNRTASIAIHE
jgi:hypothetical protein